MEQSHLMRELPGLTIPQSKLALSPLYIKCHVPIIITVITDIKIIKAIKVFTPSIINLNIF